MILSTLHGSENALLLAVKSKDGRQGCVSEQQNFWDALNFNPFSFLSCRPWWKQHLWNLEAIIPMPSVIFSPFLHHVWGLDLCHRLILILGCSTFHLYLGHLLFRCAASPSYLWTKTAFEKPWIYWGLEEGKVKGSSVKINHSVFQIKFNRSLLELFQPIFLTLCTSYTGFLFFFPPFQPDIGMVED